MAEVDSPLREAVEIGGDDPVLPFDLGVAHLRHGEPRGGAREPGPRRTEAPAALAARAEYARGKLALEEGDAVGERAGLPPGDGARPVGARLPLRPVAGPARGWSRPGDSGERSRREIGALLERAPRAVAGELPAWRRAGAMGARPGRSRRRAARGLELLAWLAAGEPRVEPLVARGRAELGRDSGPRAGFAAPGAQPAATGQAVPDGLGGARGAAGRVAARRAARRNSSHASVSPVPVEIASGARGPAAGPASGAGRAVLQVVAFNDAVDGTRSRARGRPISRCSPTAASGSWAADGAAFERVVDLAETASRSWSASSTATAWMEISCSGSGGRLGVRALGELASWRRA